LAFQQRAPPASTEAAAAVWAGTAWVRDVDAMHLALCKPLLDAIVDSCGERDGCDATPLAQAAAYVGDSASVVRLLEQGYKVDGKATGERQCRPLPSLLVRRGERAKAWDVVHADPRLGLQADSYGVTSLDLLEAHGGGVAQLPEGMAKPGHGGFAKVEAGQDEKAPAHRKAAARAARRGKGRRWTGGWPGGPEVAFPGLKISYEGPKGQAPEGWDADQDGPFEPDPLDGTAECQIAELDGYAVAQVRTLAR
jgi:hypothetical protein